MPHGQETHQKVELVNGIIMKVTEQVWVRLLLEREQILRKKAVADLSCKTLQKMDTPLSEKIYGSFFQKMLRKRKNGEKMATGDGVLSHDGHDVYGAKKVSDCTNVFHTI